MSNGTIKPIETEYKGIKFRSKLEAQWAVFFDECGANWEYEPEGFDLGDGVWYLPDFLLHNVGHCRGADENGDIWVEVKGRMTPDDAKKIDYWIHGDAETQKQARENYYFRNHYRGILVLGRLPHFDRDNKIDLSISDLAEEMGGYAYDHLFYSFSTLDGDQWGALPGVDGQGRFTLIEYEHPKGNEDMDKTNAAYRNVVNYRFDHRKKKPRKISWKKEPDEPEIDASLVDTLFDEARNLGALAVPPSSENSAPIQFFFPNGYGLQLINCSDSDWSSFFC